MIEAFLAAIALFAAATLILAALILFRLTRIVAQEPLTKDVMLQLLRGETDLLKRAAEDQARGVRGEVCENLRGFQETTVKSFGVLSDSANTQIRSFGEPPRRWDQGGGAASSWS
jgi:DNA recombination protein RmuC